MKIVTIKRLILIVSVVISIGACKKDLKPYDSKSEADALKTPADLQMATYGAYAGIKAPDYTLRLFWMSIYPSDDVALSGATTDPIYNEYTYTHFPAMGSTTVFWHDAYGAIYSANRVIEKIKDGESPALDQLKGENLFLRDLSHFFLVRFFGRPYPQGKGENPGIPIKDNTKNDLPVRNTVKEVYDFLIADLQKAANLMTESKDSRFASPETAYALLSRIYLYKENNDSAIFYANKVIDSKRYSLMATDPYKKYFTLHPEDNPETIFAIRFIPQDNQYYDAIGNQFYNDPVTQATGYGETYASLGLVNLLNQYPEDVRHSFIELQQDKTTADTLKRGGVPKFYVNKFNWQDGIANLSSPVIFRLAEMYLNRAEANAKLGNYQAAIDDVNLIRRRAGLSGSALYTVDDLKGRGSVLDVVLEERRLEFFLEGHRPFDLYRNNLPMIRHYPGFHGTDHYNFTVEPTDPQVIFLIPEREMNANPNLTQNP